MTSADILDRLAKAVLLESDDAAIRIHANYAPQSGWESKVAPPTYAAQRDGTRYHFEQRWSPNGEPIDVVVLDSIQSQAGRPERALLPHVRELGLPLLILRAELEDRTVEVSNLDAPHRSRDAYFLDSELDGVAFDKTSVGKALGAAGMDNATPFLRYAPYDLVYGTWDSHRGKRLPTKFPRVVTSEMLGWDVLKGKKAATKGDPLNLPGTDMVPLREWRPDLETKNKKATEEKLSELGHGMIPVSPDEATGGVSVRRITRQAVVSLTGLGGLHLPTENGSVDREGRVALAALALLADRLAFARAGLHLRSGADLVLQSERIEWVQRGDATEPLDLDLAAARRVFEHARDELSRAGVRWDPEPLVLAPNNRLQEIIEKTFYVAELDATG